ncbi:MAG: response regulator [Ignavibacteriota bacterium]
MPPSDCWRSTDEISSLELVQDALSQPNLEVLTSTDPEDGLRIVRRVHPEIVLLDLHMPKVSGMELLEKIVEFDPGIDVILVTGDYSTESAVEAIQKGACDYLTKPFSPKVLRQRVESLMADAETGIVHCNWKASFWRPRVLRRWSGAVRKCWRCSPGSAGWPRIFAWRWSRARRVAAKNWLPTHSISSVRGIETARGL